MQTVNKNSMKMQVATYSIIIDLATDYGVPLDEAINIYKKHHGNDCVDIIIKRLKSGN